MLIHKQLPGIAAAQTKEMPAPRMEEVYIAYQVLQLIAYQVLQLMMNAFVPCTMLRLFLTGWKHICPRISSQMLL
jgi:hypothetical protein